MSEERGFEVVDRRRVSAEPEPAGAPEQQDPHGREADEDPDSVGDGGLTGEITVNGIVQWSIGLLANKAWTGMGLIPDPISGKMDRNLAEAKRAIDVVADLVKHLMADADPQEQRELQTLLSDLRINFVKQSQGL